MLDQGSSDDSVHPVGSVDARHAQWQPAIRQLAMSELYQLQWHLLRLEDGCRRSRFGNPTCDAFVRDYAARTRASGTLLLGCFIEGRLRAVAELRSLRPQWCSKAEVALSVEAPWRGRGIATALMAELIQRARQMGIEHIYVSCHAFNQPMQRVAERFGAKLSFEDCECLGDITVRFEPMAPACEGADEQLRPRAGIVVLDL